MFEAFDRVLLAGLGALSMSRERAEKIYDEYVQKGKEVRENREGFVKEMMDLAGKTRTDLEKTISEQLKKVMDQQPVVTKKDLQPITDQLGRIEAKLDQLLGQK